MTRAFIYGRVSDPTEEDGESLKRQEQLCREYCETKGYAVAGVYRDARTGVLFRDREALRRLREDLKAGAVQVVVARDLDRLTRHQAHLYLFIEECDEHGVRVEFVNESFEDSSEGRLLRSVKAYVAEVEREKITWRTHEGLRRRVESGKPLAGCRPPYGYRWVDDAKSALEPVEPAASVVQRLYHLMAEGLSSREIAQRFMDEGIPSPTGRTRWNPASLCAMVKHPVYRGELASYRWKMGKRPPGKRHPSRTERPAAEQTPLPTGTAPALVDELTWRRAQQALAGLTPERAPRGESAQHYLLTGGFALCEGCGGKLYSSVAKGWRLYRCRTNTLAGGRRCDSFVTVSAVKLDRAVWEYVERRILNTRVFQRLVAAAHRHSEKPVARVDHLAKPIALAERRLTNLTRELSLADDEADAQVLRDERRKVVAELRSLKAEQEPPPVENTLARLTELEATQRALTSLSAHTYAEKRSALSMFDVRVMVRRGSLRTGPRWTIGSILEPPSEPGAAVAK